MRNQIYTQPSTAISGRSVAQGRGNVPPTKNNQTATCSANGDYDSDDNLKGFDYEAFLRREGYHA